MNKGLLISHLNRAKLKGDTEKIEYYEKKLHAEYGVKVQDKTVSDDNILIARKRLVSIKKMKDTQTAFCEYQNEGYNFDTIANLSTINLAETKFYQRKRNGTTQQIFSFDE